MHWQQVLGQRAALLKYHPLTPNHQKNFIIMETQKMEPPNSIAFGSAPRRVVDSQPFSPCARPAVNQTETHSVGFLSVADASPSSGATLQLRPSSGRMVMQPTGVSLVGG